MSSRALCARKEHVSSPPTASALAAAIEAVGGDRVRGARSPAPCADVEATGLGVCVACVFERAGPSSRMGPTLCCAESWSYLGQSGRGQLQNMMTGVAARMLPCDPAVRPLRPRCGVYDPHSVGPLLRGWLSTAQLAPTVTSARFVQHAAIRWHTRCSYPLRQSTQVSPRLRRCERATQRGDHHDKQTMVARCAYVLCGVCW